jgi:hypothetical protein
VFQAEGPSSDDRPISKYFEDVKLLLLKPHQFFRQMPRNAGLAQPLAFALIAHWIGSAVSFLWGAAFFRSSEEMFEKWMSIFGRNDQIDVIRRSTHWESMRHAFMDWFWGIGSVISDPFTTLLSILISSFFVFLGARLFVGLMTDAPSAPNAEQQRHQITYESAVRIMAYGAVASILQAVPIGGKFLSYFYGLYISTVGAKEIYRIGTGRALMVVLFPQILFTFVIFALFAFLLLIAVGLFGTFFSGSF